MKDDFLETNEKKRRTQRENKTETKVLSIEKQIRILLQKNGPYKKIHNIAISSNLTFFTTFLH